ncbi:MAG TPA: enoyl-CoA hydratase/isomerase family protein, partial [Acidimicrobiales bacterium]|nr:enoyl-CoA hydratase/isomerase family protein [Acidimicrobiales bacterium]
RADKANAIDEAFLGELEEVIGASGTDVLVLASSSAGAFCAGADLSLEPERLAALSDRLFAFYEQLVCRPMPVLAAVAGAAVGAGAQLLLACDVRIGGPSASVCFVGPASRLVVGSWRLPDLIGAGRAAEIVLSGRTVCAGEALAIGLLDRLVEDPLTGALGLAGYLAGCEREVVARAKSLVGAGKSLEALRREREANRGASHAAAGTRH